MYVQKFIVTACALAKSVALKDICESITYFTYFGLLHLARWCGCLEVIGICIQGRPHRRRGGTIELAFCKIFRIGFTLDNGRH